MKIVDTKTGKRVGAEDRELKDHKKKLKDEDPIIREAIKGNIDELSPMDPPDAYDKERALGAKYEDMHSKIKELMDEHKEVLVRTETFDKALLEFKESNFVFSQDINNKFNEFFVYFDEHILPHNRKEEQGLFLVLHDKLIESGEHSTGDDPSTAVDLMEDDHIKFIQLATLSFNLLGLGTRLPDNHSRALTFDLAYNNGKELVEMLNLHIFREDNTLFPLAQKLLSKQDVEQLR